MKLYSYNEDQAVLGIDYTTCWHDAKVEYILLMYQNFEVWVLSTFSQDEGCKTMGARLLSWGLRS